MIFFFYIGFILKENILLLFCDIKSSFVTSLLLNKLLLFNIYCREIWCYRYRFRFVLCCVWWRIGLVHELQHGYKRIVGHFGEVLIMRDNCYGFIRWW